MKCNRITAVLVTGTLLCSAMAGHANEADLSGKLAVELNTMQDAATGCTLTFEVINGLEAAIDQLVFETVLFDADGTVNRLTLFDFGAVPVARPRVRQFAVPDMACADLGRVLLNGVHSCTGAGITPDVCAVGVTPSSRVDVEVLG